ncbi:MAG: hypothetical protein KKA65_00090 [Nanoarchaeota archaeon]|nr:hypothetical protein [Nanoarchaeota archaeon]MBU4352129.1 hypothetical protein [Nanoarchaeota archaeon]MBU4455885.1 hypothetical protein [Nanoarchaeota archaeon]MCG2720222.1 hypothetical protein [Nanoarchaeota archaeon]
MKRTETLKYSLVSIDTMNKQVNLRLPEQLIISAKNYANKHGFATVQELIKESLREKLFDNPEISKKELALVKKLIKVSDEKNLYSTEKELFKKLKRK